MAFGHIIYISLRGIRLVEKNFGFSMLNNIGLPGFLFLAFIVYVLFLIMKPKRRSESDNPPPVRQEPMPKMQVSRTVQDYTPPQPKTEPEAEPIPPIIGKCHVVDGDTIHIGSKKITRIQ